MSTIIFGIGSNLAGIWGQPAETIEAALCLIEKRVGRIVRRSRFYTSAPVGPIRQSFYVNAAIVVEARKPPAVVLKILKNIEKEAGRRSIGSVRWGARVLDIDIIDYAGRVNRWTPPRVSQRPSRAPAFLVLPHPQAHVRRFVLQPLLDIAPNWWHPALRQPGTRLLSGLGGKRGLRRLD